jgi:hypothetical protein
MDMLRRSTQEEEFMQSNLEVLAFLFSTLREEPSAGKPRQGHPAVHPIAPSHNFCFRFEKLWSLLGITLLDSFTVADAQL